MERIDRDRIVALARDLVAIESVTGNEKGVAEYIGRFLTRAGVDYRTIESNPDQPNLLVELSGGTGSLICFNGHMDVLPAEASEGWHHPPFQATIKGPYMYGRGALDMKGSLAVYLHLIELLASDKKYQGHGAQFQFVSDEERGSLNGTRLIAEELSAGRLVRPALAIIGERSDLKMRTAERGCIQFKVRVSGRAAHTAWAREVGVNPIYYASQAILKLERPLPAFHPEVGHPVVSINLIGAGVAINQVPAQCSFAVDWRTLPGETVDEIRGQIESVMSEVCGGRDGLSFELELLNYSEANSTPRDDKAVQAVAGTLSARTGKPAEYYVGWAGSTDARYFRGVGIPAVVLGPSGGNYHGPDEYVELFSLFTLSEVFAALLYEAPPLNPQ